MMSISVIIPTLNEATCIEETLTKIRMEKPKEIIVVDGGSTDGTPELAQAADQVLHSPKGRANQMNFGARQATGDVLLFLHADCTLQTGAVQATLSRMAADKKCAACCFTMEVMKPGMAYRLIGWAASLRTQWTGLIYGDQGLAVRRMDFFRWGGFPSIPFMEDLFFSRTVIRQGRIAILPQKIFVSPRRWQKSGLVRQTLRNWSLTALVGLGFSPNFLARFYPAIR